MVHFKQFISDLITEVSYRTNSGIVDFENPDHISILSEVLDEIGLSDIKHELFQNLFEADKFSNPILNKEIEYTDANGNRKSGLVGNLLRTSKDSPGRQAAERQLPPEGSDERNAINKELGSEKGGKTDTTAEKPSGGEEQPQEEPEKSVQGTAQFSHAPDVAKSTKTTKEDESEIQRNLSRGQKSARRLVLGKLDVEQLKANDSSLSTEELNHVKRFRDLTSEFLNNNTSDERKREIANQLKEDFDAIVLCGGATVKRNIPIPGADLKGVHQAMEFLKLNNQYVDGLVEFKDILSAKDKNVIVIGGGDTGSDCIGTSNRHGAISVTNFEILSKPSEGRPANQPWPYWPMKLKTTSSHQEGVERFFSISTKEFIGDDKGNLKALKTVEVEWIFKEGERPQLKEVPNSEKLWDCDLVLLALGFTGAEKTLADQFGLEMDFRTNIKATTKDYVTNVPSIFVAGDMRRGQSLIVWAISEGRQAAHHVDTYLMGSSVLPLKDNSDLPRV